MEIRLLQTFQKIVQEGSFHRAAEVLKYSQPTVTVQVKRLEEELGLTLLKRGKKTSLTEDGEVVLQHAEQLLRAYEQFQHAVELYKQGNTGAIRLGASEVFIGRYLPTIVASFRKEYPQIELRIDVGSPTNLAEKVLKHDFDYALSHSIGTPSCIVEELPDGLDYIHLQTFGLVLLVPDDHFLSSVDEIVLEDLQKEPMISTISLSKLSSQPTIVENTSFLKDYVAAGAGLAFVPSIEVNSLPKKVIYKEVKDLKESFSLGLLLRNKGDYAEAHHQSMFHFINQMIKKY